MKLATRKSAGVGVQRRLQMQSARTRAAALREFFPQVATLRFELRFEEPGGRPLSPQQHTLYPAARAFFRFACPCAECDGDFDLTTVVTTLVNDLSRPGRAVTGAAGGELRCEGWRARERATARPCTIELHYRLSVGATGSD
ncbi:MAG: hypothetical protein IT495_03000 [Gammaproteobacteria bacterium]|nr:hypothetical protein [Gammaproteobacteria bacterium]